MREKNRSANDEVLSSLISELEKKELPQSMEASRQSLLKKLKTEQAKSRSSYVDDGSFYKTPSMGIVELSHESLSEPKYLFGTDVKNKDIVRIKVFSAYKNIVNGEILKDELLSEIVMSETQFGNVIVKNDTKGSPVTIVHDFSEDVSEYDPDHDISKQNMSEVISNVTGPCPQVERFMTTVSAAINKAIADGKLNKRDSEQLCFTIKSVSSQVIGNNVFYVNRFTEEMGKRTDEAALNMNISVKNLQLISHKR